jgi:hypothetical protein
MDRDRVVGAIRTLERLVLDDNHRFDMLNWVTTRRRDGRHCGMAACAGGWMALDPWHNERGLRANVATNYVAFEDDDGKVYFDLGAMAEYLGISHHDAHRVFTHGGYWNRRSGQDVTREMVASRLRAMLVFDIALVGG